MFAKLLTTLAYRTMHRPCDFTIGGADKPYMMRWYVIPRNRLFNVYVHVILRDDDDIALHDHPWVSLSYMVQGRMIELYRDRDGQTNQRYIFETQWRYRGMRFAHRLRVEGISDGPAVTVFMTGPKLRTWGFWCRQGWRPYNKVIAKSGDRSNIAAGCDID